MKQFVFLAIAMFIYSATFAQAVKKTSTTLNQETVVTVGPEEKSGYSVFQLGVSFPGGDLGDEDYVGVGTGFGIGLKSYKPLESMLPNLSLVFGAELYYHGLSSDVKDDWEENYGSSADITYPMYFNLPVTIGANYTLPLQNSLGVYGEFALGANVSYITKEALEDGDEKYECSYDPAFGFCYGIEAGIVLNNKFHIGIRHNNLGSYKYKWKEEYSSPSYSWDDKGKTEKIDLSNTVIVLGIRF